MYALTCQYTFHLNPYVLCTFLAKHQNLILQLHLKTYLSQSKYVIWLHQLDATASDDESYITISPFFNLSEFSFKPTSCTNLLNLKLRRRIICKHKTAPLKHAHFILRRILNGENSKMTFNGCLHLGYLNK